VEKRPETKPKGEETDEKPPVKSEEKVPAKGEEKPPVKREKKDPGLPGVRPAPLKTDPAIPERKEEMKNPKEPGPGLGRPRPGDEKKDPSPGKQSEGRPRNVMPKNGAEVEKAVIEGLSEDFSDQQRLIYRNLEEPEITY